MKIKLQFILQHKYSVLLWNTFIFACMQNKTPNLTYLSNWCGWPGLKQKAKKNKKINTYIKKILWRNSRCNWDTIKLKKWIQKTMGPTLKKNSETCPCHSLSLTHIHPSIHPESPSNHKWDTIWSQGLLVHIKCAGHVNNLLCPLAWVNTLSWNSAAVDKKVLCWDNKFQVNVNKVLL